MRTTYSRFNIIVSTLITLLLVAATVFVQMGSNDPSGLGFLAFISLSVTSWLLIGPRISWD